MKKRILKVMSMMLVAATLMTGTGFNEVVTVKAETLAYGEDGYNQKGYDKDGYDREGYDYHGYDKNGYNREGYDRYGYDRDGYDKNGYDKERYDRDGYDYFYGRDKEGYNRDGYNEAGYDRNGYDKYGYDVNGYDKEGYDHAGYGKDGYDREGYDENGYDRDGYDKKGYDKNHRDRNGKYDPAYARNPYKEDIVDDIFKIIPRDCHETKNSYLIKDSTGKNGKKIVDGLKAKIKNHKDNWNFTAKITPIAVKHGYGYYKLTLKYNERYNNYVYTTTIKVFPEVVITGEYWTDEKGQMYVIGTKNAFKNIDGAQYKMVNLDKNNKVMLNKYISSKSILAKKDLKDMGNKQYKKLYAKAQKDFLKEYGFNSKDGTVKFFSTKPIPINNMGCGWITRVYIVVNGKRYYS